MTHGASKLSKTREEPDYTSYDAPPLDFSYKNILNLECTLFHNEEIRSIEPRQGHKHSAEK